jgi:lipoate-protein ligase B
MIRGVRPRPQEELSMATAPRSTAIAQTRRVREAVVLRTDRIGFEEAFAIQRRLARARREGTVPDVLWVLEHDPAYTTGRHGDRGDLFLSDAQLAGMGAAFHRTDRGGNMTWHGPGQSVGYVISDLRGTRRIRDFVTALAEATAAASGIPGATIDGAAMGAYVDGRKIGSVGIRVREGISAHGVALNRNPDPAWFAAMTACGAPEVVTTSIAAEGGDAGRRRVEDDLVAARGVRLGLRAHPAALDELLAAQPKTGSITSV